MSSRIFLGMLPQDTDDQRHRVAVKELVQKTTRSHSLIVTQTGCLFLSLCLYLKSIGEFDALVLFPSSSASPASSASSPAGRTFPPGY